mgnify:CR=1 FL=1
MLPQATIEQVEDYLEASGEIISAEADNELDALISGLLSHNQN